MGFKQVMRAMAICGIILCSVQIINSAYFTDEELPSYDEVVSYGGRKPPSYRQSQVFGKSLPSMQEHSPAPHDEYDRRRTSMDYVVEDVD